jgi:hypothetical protein
MTNNEKDKIEDIKARLTILRKINTELSRLLKKNIRLSNFGQKHPNSYCFVVEDEVTNIVVGYEELMFFRTHEDIIELAYNLQDRLDEDKKI